jgi:hypothetical protein
MARFPLALGLVVACSCGPRTVAEEGKAGSVPILYSTDLYHPHDDPDDHFDLATLFGIPEFGIRGIIIDTGPGGAGRPGVVAIRQLMHITGRPVPCTVGLIANLRSLGDGCEQQPAASQDGVGLILKTLRESKTPVTLFTTGSLRDVAAAFNRDPALFRTKAARLYINVGHSGGDVEWNVKLDPHAFVRMLDSGLPIHWVPCFGADGFESFWQFRQADVLESAPLAVQNVIVYALTKASPKEVDPIEALSRPIAGPTREKIWAETRSMWCTGALLHAAGRRNPTFAFRLAKVHLDNNGTTRITHGQYGLEVLTFHRGDASAYAVSMQKALREILRDLPRKR